MHLGAGQWMIVDSCVDQVDGTIPVIEYLRSIGVDIAKAVSIVVGTHAHDDHIAGLARVLEECSNATFVCSTAASNEEFYALVAEDARFSSHLRRSSYREYRDIFRVAKGRRFSGGRRPLVRAVEQLHLTCPQIPGVKSALIQALSPSQEALDRAQTALAQGAATEGENRRLKILDPNGFAVALWVQVESRGVLLGADVLKGPGNCGWRGILDWFKPASRGEVFKVPHHGAPNAHLDEVWRDLLVESPVALIAPYRAGRAPRPSVKDRKRILSLAPEAFVTASVNRPAPSRAVRDVAAVMNQLAKNVRDPWGKSGHVRARAHHHEGDWKVETFAPARKMTV